MSAIAMDRTVKGAALAALMALAGASLAGCAGQAATADVPTTKFTNSASDPQVVQQIMADSGYLQKNRLAKRPKADIAPKAEAGCPDAKVKDRGGRQMLLPADLMTTLVMHDAKPWAYLKYDVDSDGSPINVTIVQSAGLKSFDRAAIETVMGWKFDLLGGLKEARGCMAEVAIT